SQLETDQDEQDRIDDEVEDVPDVVALQARLRERDDLRPADTHVDARCHGRQDSGDANRIRRYEGRVAGEQGDRDAYLRVLDAPADLGGDPANRDANRDAATGTEDEPQPGMGEREAAGNHRGDRYSVGDERGGVVEQP